jgi:hypothetical protein
MPLQDGTLAGWQVGALIRFVLDRVFADAAAVGLGFEIAHKTADLPDSFIDKLVEGLELCLGDMSNIECDICLSAQLTGRRLLLNVDHLADGTTLGVSYR